MNLSGIELAQVAIQLVLVASILAVTSSALFLLLDRTLGKVGHWLTSTISILCIAVAIAIGIENFIYTVFGSGMKSSNFIVLKILIVYLSIRVSLDIYKKITSSKRFTQSGGGLVTLVLALLAILSILPSHTSSSALSPYLPTKPQPNIIIISADGVNSERMGVYGYERDTTPFLSEKANEFAIFENAFTNNANTTGSITSMLTGMSPIKTGVIYPPDIMRGPVSTKSLPQLLGQLGYQRSNWSVSYYSSAHAQNMADAFDYDNGSMIFSNITKVLPDSYELSRWLITSIIKDFIEMTHGAFLFQEMDNPFNLVSNQESFTQDTRNLEGALRDINSSNPFFINTHFMMTHGEYFPIKNPYFSKGSSNAINGCLISMMMQSGISIRL